MAPRPRPAAPPPRIVYLDAGALRCIIEADDRMREHTLQFLLHLPFPPRSLLTSELAIAQVLPGPVRARRRDLINAYDDLLRTFITPVPIQRRLLAQAARLLARTPGLALPDAVHLACARQHGAQVFATTEVQLAVEPPMRKWLLVAPGGAAVQPSLAGAC